MSKINEIIDRFKENKNAVEILQAIQDEFGFISKDNMISISKELKIPMTDLYGVATFYTQFKLKPKGKYVISVCRGTACHVKNSKKLLEHLEEKLKIKAGETTEDLKFTLECVNCLGACAKAPAITVNEKVYGNLTTKMVDEIIKELK